jgi:hypothetical protein
VAIPALVVPIASLACSGSAHIELREAGVYALDQEDIVVAQPRLGDCRSDELALSWRGHEVPLRVVGDRDGKFAPGAHIEWVGEALHGPSSWFDTYTLDNAYILSAAPGTHARLRAATAAGVGIPARLVRRAHFEQQNELIRLNRQTMKQGDEPDIWEWAKLTYVDAKPFTVDFDLPDLAATDAAGTTVDMLLDFRGISYIVPVKDAAKPLDHVVEVQVNGRPATVLNWDGRAETSKKIALPRAALKPRGNVLSLRIPERVRPGGTGKAIVDQVMFNWLEVAYPINGDLTASAAPLQIAAGAKAPASVELSATAGTAVSLYAADGSLHAATAGANRRVRFADLAPGVDLYPVIGSALRKPSAVRAVADIDLRNPGAGYDYLIVSHASLIDAVQPLAEFHRRHGLKVGLVDVEQIYDVFNNGIVHPSAIRDLIAWGREHWSVKPRYVLLVGTASFDIRESGKPVTLQPDSFSRATGVPFSKRSDIVAGAGTQAANRNLIPTWQYPSDEGQSASDNPFVVPLGTEHEPALAIGRFPVVTAAQAEAVVRKTIDYAAAPNLGAWRHRVMLIANENSSFQGASDTLAVGLGQKGFTAEKIYGNPAELDNVAREAEISESLNSGELLVHFLGHGGRLIWRTGPPDFKKNHDLFTLDDVSDLRNGGHLPMVLSMTCFSAPFDNPNEDSIGERFLREPDRGAVAVFAASWTNAPNLQFSKKLVDELTQPGRPIGDAILAAKKETSDHTMVEMYNLLGDPALVLKLPQERVQIVRNRERWTDRIGVRVPESGFGGAVTVDWIDEKGSAVQSRTYEARDSQFELAVPPNAATVRIYAANFRTGRDALGSLDLRLSVPTPVAAARRTWTIGKSAATMRAKAGLEQPAATTRALAGPEKPPVKVTPALTKSKPDVIGHFSFDAPADTRAMPPVENSRDGDKSLRSGTAVEPKKRGKCPPQQQCQ